MDSIHDSISELLEMAKTAGIDGTGLLYFAASRIEYSDSYTRVLRIFLEHGIHPEPSEQSYMKPFIVILEKGDLEAVELMIEYGIELKNYVKEFPLHRAARNPRLEVLEFLLRSELFDPNETNVMGYTALMDALQAKNPGAVELLLEWGLRPNSFDNNGFTPLQCVDYDDETEETTKCIEILLCHGADPDAEVIEGDNALKSVAKKRNSELDKRLRLFVEHGAGKKNEEAMYQVLDTLITHGDLETLQLYIKQQNIDLIKCKEKWSLRSAIWNSHPTVFEFLFNTGVFDVTKENCSHWNGLYFSVMMSNPEAMKLFLDWGVEVDKADSIGQTPLFLAAFRANMNSTKDASVKCMELLLLHGADINCKYLASYTAFDEALPYGVTSWTELPEIPPVAMTVLAQANLLESQGKRLKSYTFHQREAENKRCQAELEALKAEILGDSITLYDVLAGGNSRFYSKKSELMRKLRDCEYVRSLEGKFPIYGRRLVKLVDHVKLREIAADRVSRLVGLDRDSFHIIIEKIVRMLFIKDLRTLSRL